MAEMRNHPRYVETTKNEIVECRQGAPWDVAAAMGLVFASFPLAHFLNWWWLTLIVFGAMFLYDFLRHRDNFSASGTSYSSFKPLDMTFVGLFIVGMLASFAEPRHLWSAVLAALLFFVITFFIVLKAMPWFYPVPQQEQDRIRAEKPKDAVLW